MSRVISSRHLTLHDRGRLLIKALCLSAAISTSAALAVVSQTPVFLPQPVKPNIMYTLDNSGSMQWGTVTGYDGSYEYTSNSTNDSTGPVTNATRNARAYYSSDYNGIWYNPAITYSLPVNYDGTSFSISDPAHARLDPYPTSTAPYGTNTVNLKETCYSAAAFPALPLYTYAKTSSIWNTSVNTTNCAVTPPNGKTNNYARYAFYYVWNKSTNIASATPPDTAFTTRVDIISTVATYNKAAGRTDCGSGTTCTYAQEIQNFANWFTYYRTRILMQKTAMGQAFAGLDPVQVGTYTPRFRVGFNTINAISSSGSVTLNNTGVTDSASWQTIRDFDQTQKQTFYSKLYAINPNQGTPLRSQMDRIGKLYQGNLTGFDYTNNDPNRLSATDSTLVSCRASYHIMSTDGYWNDSYSGVGDVDSDGSSNTLADIALNYYKTDLRPTLTDNVKFKAGAKDNVAWQHMTTFTIGLGANGTLINDPNYETATPPYTETKAGANNWPTPVSDKSTTIDDLWHAAVNGRGHYYSAKNPNDLRDGLISTLKAIDDQTGAAAGIGINNSNVVGGDAYVYQPSFESGTWLGHLQALGLDAVGNLVMPQAWDAATQLPASSARNIVTWNGSTGVGFAYGNLTAIQKTSLGAISGNTDTQNGTLLLPLLNYLRGDGTNEQTVNGQGPGTYRYRASKLGDIVNSAPLYVKNSNFSYQMASGTNSGASTYSTFVSTTRTPMVYVGANDGMLHAFDAATGIEKFAYVPNSVYANLKSLSDPGYVHKYFVDGPLTEGDAYDGSTWKKYLVGSTGAGAKSVFALDITTPASLGAGSVKWEKTASDAGFADIGYVLGRAAVVRLTTGAWAAIFSNGYESASGNSVLYLVNIGDGSLIKAITVGTTTGGLSTPALLFNDKRELIMAYAGDLGGNLWKFDLTGAASGWGGSKLFSATNGTQVQPIIQKPILEAHPNGGYMVSVGTGKFYEAADKINTDVQGIYGIWDKPGATSVVAKTSLVAQTLTSVTGGRTLSNATIDWTIKRGWYIDLIGSGERVVGDLLFDSNLILLATTFAPTNSICDGGGTSQFMGFNYLTGGASDKVTFKTANGIAIVDSHGNAISSVNIGGTISSPTSINVGKGRRIFKFNPITGGQFDVSAQIDVKPLRTWHQLTIKH